MPPSKIIPSSVTDRIRDMDYFPPEGWKVFDYYLNEERDCELALVGREVFGNDDRPPRGLEGVRGTVIDLRSRVILFSTHAYNPRIYVDELVDPVDGLVVTAPNGAELTLRPPILLVPNEPGPVVGIGYYKGLLIFANNKQFYCYNSYPGTLITYGQMYKELGGIDPEELFKNFLNEEGTSPVVFIVRLVHPAVQMTTMRFFPHLTLISTILLPGFTENPVHAGPMWPAGELSYKLAHETLWPAIQAGEDPRLAQGDSVVAVGDKGTGARVTLYPESARWRDEIRGEAGSFPTVLCKLIGAQTGNDGVTYLALHPDILTRQTFPEEVKRFDTWWGRVLNTWLLLLNAVSIHHREEVIEVLATLYGKPDDPTHVSAPPEKRNGGVFRQSPDWLIMQYNCYRSHAKFETVLLSAFNAVRARIRLLSKNNEEILRENARNAEKMMRGEKTSPMKELHLIPSLKQIFAEALFSPQDHFYNGEHLFKGEALAIIYRETRNMIKLGQNVTRKAKQLDFVRNPVISFGEVDVDLRTPPDLLLPAFAELTLQNFPPLPSKVETQPRIPRVPLPHLPNALST
jgi:hypothetical protein